MREAMTFRGYPGIGKDGVLTYLDLRGCNSIAVIESLPKTVKTIVLNETAVITMFRELTKKNNVTQIELRGYLPSYITSGLKLNHNRMIRISGETHEPTITGLKSIAGLSTVSLLSSPSQRIPVDLIKKIPDNVKIVHVPLCISTEEVRALGESVQRLCFTSSIASQQDAGLCAALLESIPEHIAVYGLNKQCIRPAAIHQETSSITRPSSSIVGVPASAGPEPVGPVDLYKMIREIREGIEQDKDVTIATRAPSFFPLLASSPVPDPLAPPSKKQRVMTEEEKDVAELLFALGRTI